VIDGHVDSDRHGASVFYGLDTLTGGDHVEVARADGRKAVFEVEHVASTARTSSRPATCTATSTRPGCD